MRQPHRATTVVRDMPDVPNQEGNTPRRKKRGQRPIVLHPPRFVPMSAEQEEEAISLISELLLQGLERRRRRARTETSDG
jgi:hypothetical protein